MPGLTMSDLDPTEANSLEELAECLNQLHIRADRPAYRELEQRTIHENGLLPGTRLKRTRLGRTTLSDVLLGRKFPGKAFMLTFVVECGIDLEKDPRWEQTWDRLAWRYLAQGAVAEAERLRQQLTAALATKTEADQARQAAEQATKEAQQAAQAKVERVQAELAEREAELSAELERARTEAAATIEAAQQSARAQVAEAQQAAAEQVQAALADRDETVAAANERTRTAEQEASRTRQEVNELWKEARAQAERMLTAAQEQAEKAIVAARAEADRIRNQARTEREEEPPSQRFAWEEPPSQPYGPPEEKTSKQPRRRRRPKDRASSAGRRSTQSPGYGGDGFRPAPSAGSALRRPEPPPWLPATTGPGGAPLPSDAARLSLTGVRLCMPQLGESVTEGTVTRWLKREGDRVEADEPLLEVSTDKVDSEIPSPAAGILHRITVAEDETVAVGAELAVIVPDTPDTLRAGLPVCLPAGWLDETITEGTVTRWLKREGDRVEADEPLLEVSTDKFDTEIPSPGSGILRGITVAKDETVAVGAQLAVIVRWDS